MLERLGYYSGDVSCTFRLSLALEKQRINEKPIALLRLAREGDNRTTHTNM